MTQVSNPFAAADDAERYAAGRPYFHPQVLQVLEPLLQQGVRGRDTLGVDVACGTGLSSLALADWVDEVRAFDLSEAMLDSAKAHPRTQFAQAAAEALPLGERSADVMTVAQAFHWFDRARFLAEARRVLKPTGVLVLYDCYFVGEMPAFAGENGQPDFGEFAQRYFARYPTPPRHREPFGVPEAAAAGFGYREGKRPLDLPMTRAELVAYLLTQSNTLAVTAHGQSEASIREWLQGELSNFFAADEAQAVRFLTWHAVLQPLP